MIKLSFIFGSALTFLGSMLHIAIMIGGPDWYLASGAGENIAKLAESGSMYPSFIGSILVCIFFGWSLYALSGAGIIRRLPFLKICLMLITGLCIVRGVYGFFVPLLFNSAYVVSLGMWFWVLSSIIWLAIGIFYAVGIRSNWSYISVVKT
jgi:putative oxidoreductase